MGDRYILTVICTECGAEDKDIYYAPTCGFTTHHCLGCGFETNLEEYTGISYEDASNLQEIERTVSIRKEKQMNQIEIQELVESIEASVPYIIATLDMAIYDSSDSEWGRIHKGRARSSIRQLEALLQISNLGRKKKKAISEYQKRKEKCLYEELKHIYPELAPFDERTPEEKKRDAEQDRIDLFGPE